MPPSEFDALPGTRRSRIIAVMDPGKRAGIIEMLKNVVAGLRGDTQAAASAIRVSQGLARTGKVLPERPGAVTAAAHYSDAVEAAESRGQGNP